MNKLRKIALTLFLIFFSACGSESDINPSLGFDMWDYMTSARNYEVEYDVYENNLKTDFYVETHRQFGTQYERQSSNGLTTLFLSSNTILMREPSRSTNIIRFLHLGDTGVFQSPTIQLCSLNRFYDTYQNKGSIFNNVLQVACTSTSGVYQEFYYGYNEGIVAIYQENSGFITEYVKVSERAIF
jgi:carboxylesterase type B